jgi:hypothetical protein
MAKKKKRERVIGGRGRLRWWNHTQPTDYTVSPFDIPNSTEQQRANSWPTFRNIYSPLFPTPRNPHSTTHNIPPPPQHYLTLCSWLWEGGVCRGGGGGVQHCVWDQRRHKSLGIVIRRPSTIQRRRPIQVGPPMHLLELLGVWSAQLLRLKLVS